MAYEIKLKEGTLHLNKKKEPGTQQPDATGSLRPVCAKCGHSWLAKLSGWINISANGNRWTKLKLDDDPITSGPQPQAEKMDDDIPF